MRHLIIYVLAILIYGCSAANNSQSTKPDFFSSLETSTESDYGYSKDNPILIGHYNHWQKNTNLALQYLSRLRLDGQQLSMLYHFSVGKPEDQPRKKALPSRYGNPSSLGGELLDNYVLVTTDKSDTISLYFDVEIEGTTMVPAGLTIE